MMTGLLMMYLLAIVSVPTASQTDRLLDSIGRLVVFFDENRPSQTPDAILGIQFSKLQLDEILTHVRCLKVSPRAVEKTIMVLRQKIAHILEDREKTFLMSNSFESGHIFGEIVKRHLLNPSIWQTGHPHGQPSCEPPKLRVQQLIGSFRQRPKNPRQETPETRATAYEALFDQIDQGLPSTYDSDKCLAEILNGLGSCALSTECLLRIMSTEHVSHGYHLTHKLLYYMVLDRKGCTSSLPVNKSFQPTVSRLCHQIWTESELIKSAGYPKDMHDLIIEQTFLCAFNGYAEFFDTTLINQILNWQQADHGCFEYNVYSKETDPLYWKTLPNWGSRQKRSASPQNNNCSDHMSGLALAALSQYLKYSLLMHV